MEESNYSETLEDFQEFEENKLPQFLNVLTILTFIGSGLSIIFGLYGLATVQQQQEQIAEFERTLGGTAFGDQIIASARMNLEHNTPLQTNVILVAIACIVGAYLMRKLKKNGFYIYLLACIASIAVPISITGLGEGIIGQTMIVGILITAAFVVMYGVNLKHLK